MKKQLKAIILLTALIGMGASTVTATGTFNLSGLLATRNADACCSTSNNNGRCSFTGRCIVDVFSSSNCDTSAPCETTTKGSTFSGLQN